MALTATASPTTRKFIREALKLPDHNLHEMALTITRPNIRLMCQVRAPLWASSNQMLLRASAHRLQ